MTKKQRSIVDMFKLGTIAIILTIITFYFVIPIIVKSRKKTFVEEINKYVKKAEDTYVSDYFIDESIDNKEKCFDIKEIAKGLDKSYKGIVVIKYDNSNLEEYIYLSNGSYVYNSHSSYKAINTDDLLDGKYSKPYYRNCERYIKGRLY